MNGKAPVEPRADICGGEFGGGQSGDEARAGGGAFERRIVDDDGDVIARETHVKFNSICAIGESAGERDERVFGRDGSCAASLMTLLGADGSASAVGAAGRRCSSIIRSISA